MFHFLFLLLLALHTIKQHGKQIMEKIDSLDKKIMGIISKNARLPFKDVATE